MCSSDLDVRLYTAVGDSLGALIDQSVSTIDNVENIYRPSLAPGRYAIEVRSDQSWDVALTWQAHLSGAPALSAALTGSNRAVDLDSTGRSVNLADSLNGIRSAMDVAHDASGYRYVLDAVGSQIRRFDANGASMVFADSSDGLLFPTSLATAADGSVYVTNYLTDQVIRISASGQGSVFSQGSKGLSDPFGVAVAPDGTVYVAEVDEIGRAHV